MKKPKNYLNRCALGNLVFVCFAFILEFAATVVYFYLKMCDYTLAPERKTVVYDILQKFYFLFGKINSETTSCRIYNDQQKLAQKGEGQY